MTGQLSLYDFGLEKQKEWQYDEDNGSVMCRCPDCGGRLLLHVFQYWNPYKYCPYCGMRLTEGKFVNKCCAVYGRKKEDYKEVRRKYGYA